LTTWYFVRRDDEMRATDDSQGSQPDELRLKMSSHLMLDRV
jgi:hypothetical protein